MPLVSLLQPPEGGVGKATAIAMMDVVASVPELLWSMPLEGDEVAALVVDAQGRVAVSTSRERVESREGGFDTIESGSTITPRGSWHHNYYAHRSYGFDAGGRLAWKHRKLRVSCVIPEGWAAQTDRHDLVIINHEGVATRQRRLAGENWRICGWQAGKPVVSSNPAATWVAPYVYSARDRQLQYADEAGRLLGALDLARTLFDEECRRDPPPSGLPDSFLFPNQMELIANCDQKSVIATHRFMGWIAKITLDGELSWVRLVDQACCNRASIVGDHIVHTSACGGKVTLLADDGRVLASRQVPHVHGAVPDDRGGLCVRVSDGIQGFDEHLEPTWELSTDGMPRVTARGGIVYVVAGRPGTLALSAYALA